MNKVIVFTNENGGVSVCVPSSDISIEEVQAKDIPQNIESYIIEYSNLPINDNDFFDAWEQTNGVISVNFTKAKEITKTRLRTEREPLLAQQDILFQRALESGVDTSAIVAEKQRLRNVPTLTDICTSTAELRVLKAAI